MTELKQERFRLIKQQLDNIDKNLFKMIVQDRDEISEEFEEKTINKQKREILHKVLYNKLPTGI